MESKYYDRNICRLYLAGFCPYEKMDSCMKVHSLELRQKYEEAKAEGQDNYDRDLKDVLEKLITDCDAKIRKALERLKDEDPKGVIDISVSKVTQSPEILNLSKQIKEKLKDVDRCDFEGETDRRNDDLEILDKLRTQRAAKQATLLRGVLDKLHRPLENPLPVAREALEEAKALQKTKPRHYLCDICGASLSVYDRVSMEQPLADHFTKKIHLGYMQIREKLADIHEARKLKRKSHEDESRHKEIEQARKTKESRGYKRTRRSSLSRDCNRDHNPPTRDHDRPTHDHDHYRSEVEKVGGSEESKDYDPELRDCAYDYGRCRVLEFSFDNKVQKNSVSALATDDYKSCSVFRLIVMKGQAERIIASCKVTGAHIRIFGVSRRIIFERVLENVKVYNMILITGKQEPAMKAAISAFKIANVRGATGNKFCLIRFLMDQSQLKLLKSKNLTTIKIIDNDELPFFIEKGMKLVQLQGQFDNVLRELYVVLKHERGFLVPETALPLYKFTTAKERYCSPSGENVWKMAMRIPVFYAAIVFGRKYTEIQDMQDQSGAEIVIISDSQGYLNIEIRGSSNEVENAQKRIRSKVVPVHDRLCSTLGKDPIELK